MNMIIQIVTAIALTLSIIVPFGCFFLGEKSKKRYKKYKKWAKRHRHHCPDREVVVMHRPPGGRYVMYAGSPHWYADDVLYRIERRGDSNCYIVVNFSL